MTSTLFIVTFLGTLTGYPLMKKWNALQLEAKDETKEQYPTVFSHLSKLWTVSVFAIPLMIYRFEFVLVIAALAILGGLFPPIIVPLLAALVFFAYFTNPVVCMAGFLLVAIPVMVVNRRSFNLREYSFKNVTLACALSVLLVESVLMISAQTNWMTGNPEMLTWMGGERSIPSLISSLKQPELSVKNAALKELVKYEGKAWPLLLQDFENGDTLQQRYTVEVGIRNGKISEITNKGDASIPAFESALNSDDAEISQAAINELLNLKAVPQLLAILPQKALNNYWNSVPPMAFAALRTFKTEKILPKIMATFRGVPLDGLDYGVSRQIAKFGNEAIPILMKSLESNDNYEARLAEYSLLEIGMPAKPFLLNSLAHAKGYRKYGSGIVLSELGVREAMPYLIEMLNDPKGRNHAVWCLGELQDERATPSLIALYQKFPERETLRNIGMTGGPEAKLFLKELMLNTPDPQIRQDAFDITAQAFWGDERNSGIRMYVSLLAAPEKEIRQNAAKQIREFNEPSLLPFLIEADKREHKGETAVGNCELHVAIEAFSK